MIILETSRLYLKTIEKEDTEVLYETIFSDEETMQYSFTKAPLSLEKTKKFIYKNFCKNNANVGLAPLFEKKSGLLVGFAGVLKNKDLGNDCYDFNVVISKNYKEEKYQEEISQAQIIFMKRVLKKDFAYTLIDFNDKISKNIMEKIKMNFQEKITVNEKDIKEVYSKKL